MQIINAILLFLAILLMWSTLNLERSTANIARPGDQSSQLADSMEFLRKIKNKSPKEESQSKRVDAYKKIAEESLKDNPESIDRVESKFDKGTKHCSSLMNGLSRSSDDLVNKFEAIKQDIDSVKSIEHEKFSETSTLLKEMMIAINDLESSTRDVENSSLDLSNQIAEVKSGVVF